MQKQIFAIVAAVMVLLSRCGSIYSDNNVSDPNESSSPTYATTDAEDTNPNNMTPPN